MKLWIDDFRPPPDKTWRWAKSSGEAIELIRDNIISIISFDHDLGGPDTARPVVLYIEKRAFAGHCPPPQWYVHSMNPVGAEWIRSAMTAIETRWSVSRETIGRKR
jgi:hypothetical protein